MVHVKEANAVRSLKGEALIAAINLGITIQVATTVLVNANAVESLICRKQWICWRPCDWT